MSLLEKVDVIEVPAAKEEFVAAEKFVPGNGVIAWMSMDAREVLLGFVEENVPAGMVRISRLTKDSVDGPILKELAENVQIALAHFYFVLEQSAQAARRGEEFHDWLICYSIKDWAFDAYWIDDGWNLLADSVSYPYPWNAYRQVLSRDS